MKILVYRIGQLGDALVSVPSVWLLRQNFPEAQIDLLTNKPAMPAAITTADVFKGTGLFTNTHLYPHSKNLFSLILGMIALLTKLRRVKYDAVAYLAPSGRTRWQIRRDRIFFRTAGIKKIWGAQFVNIPNDHQKLLPLGKRESEILAERLNLFDLKPVARLLRYDLNLTEAERQEAYSHYLAPIVTNRKFLIAVCPFSAQPATRWPLERYVTVLQELSRSYGCWPLIVGGRYDWEQGEYIIGRVGSGINLAGFLDIRQTAAIMTYCTLYLGNDTGAMHLAAAAGLPCVAVFSARNIPGKWYPAGNRNRILRLAVECEGCQLHICTKERMRCMTEIDEDAVLAQVLDLLGHKESSICAE